MKVRGGPGNSRGHLFLGIGRLFVSVRGCLFVEIRYRLGHITRFNTKYIDTITFSEFLFMRENRGGVGGRGLIRQKSS